MNDMQMVLVVVIAFLVGILCFLAIAETLDRQKFHKDLQLHREKVTYQTAVHEAGHALTVVRSSRVNGTLHLVTTVPDRSTGGKVQFNLTGFQTFVMWEHVIICLGGAAGEYIARGFIDKHACGVDLKDALDAAHEIASKHSAEEVKDIVVDMQAYYDKRLHPDTLKILNFCMNEAIKRLRTNQSDFYRLVNSLIERRELTGVQVQEVLSKGV